MGHYLFFDASALVKRYHPEKGANIVEHIFNEVFARNDLSVTISALGLAETVSVLVRKKNRGDLPANVFQKVQARLLVEATKYGVQPLSNAIVSSSLLLISKHSINATDAICLYQAITLQNLAKLEDENNRVILVTSDKRLLRATEAEGLFGLNPEMATVKEVLALLGA